MQDSRLRSSKLRKGMNGVQREAHPHLQIDAEDAQQTLTSSHAYESRECVCGPPHCMHR